MKISIIILGICILLLTILFIGCIEEGNYTITGYIYDGSYPVGDNVPISNAMIEYNGCANYSNDSGFFRLDYYGSHDPIIEVIAEGYHDYLEKPSRMVNGAFYLIPSGQVYEDFSILTWNYEESNTQNWHRKWERQTEFYIIKNKASEKQINDLINILKEDEYNKMTGGLYHSNVTIHVLDSDPNWFLWKKNGKTKIYFADGIIIGGIAHSEDGGDGIIDYAEIGWNTNQIMDDNIVWHELSHTVTAGGHINYRPSVNNEIGESGYVFPEDEKIFNCIYNSPPKRDN